MLVNRLILAAASNSDFEAQIACLELTASSRRQKYFFNYTVSPRKRVNSERLSTNRGYFCVLEI
jgi:hypothetical protein